MMKYEHIYESPLEQLRVALDFADVRPHDAQLLSKAVSYARFENMRQLEAELMLRHTALHPTDKHDTRTYKTRKGIVGDHINEFSDADRAYADRYIREHLHPEFGYGESAASRL